MAYENKSNVVDVYVRYLRDKIDRPFGISAIGSGYRLTAPAAPGSGPASPTRQ